MSVSANTSPEQGIAALLENEHRDLARATARHTLLTGLLRQLPATSPAPVQVFDSAYCGKATIIFDGAHLAQQLLALYPPEPLLDISGSTRTQKPARWLRDEDRYSAHAELYPVLEKSDRRQTHLQWWTCMAPDPSDPSDTVDVAIQVRNAGLGALVIPAGAYQPDSQSYSTGHCSFLERKLRHIPGIPCARGRWQAAWEQFVQAQGYTALQLQFVRALYNIRVRLARDLSVADLPEPHYAKPGMALAIPPGSPLPGYVENALRRERERQPHALDRTGDFWAVFTQEEVQTLLAFMAGHFAAEAAAETAYAQEVEQLKAWLTGYLAAYPGSVPAQHCRSIAARVEQACRKATKLDVSLHLDARTRGELHIGMKLEGDRTHQHLTVQCREWDSTILLPQALPCEYAPLAGDATEDSTAQSAQSAQ